jgi:hypothetical protein
MTEEATFLERSNFFAKYVTIWALVSGFFPAILFPPPLISDLNVKYTKKFLKSKHKITQKTNLERATGFEPATLGLGSLPSHFLSFALSNKN